MARSTPDWDGPDISHWNPIRDWDEIPDYDLWCMKATEGKGFRSPVFDTNWNRLRQLNAAKGSAKYRGAYHWIRSDSTMYQQVQNLKRAINDNGGLKLGEFIMLDWETTPNIRAVRLSEVEEWLERAEKEWPGRIIVYCSDWVPHFVEWRNKYPDYPLWYANYRLVRDDRGGEAESDKWGADVWQWTSSALVPGFADETIDMNDVLDWDTIARISGYEKHGIGQPKPPTQPPAAWPPYNPPSSWGLFPLDQNKPTLRQTPARNAQSAFHVTYLQDVLRLKCGRPKLTRDGWFGPQTEQAVREFQKWWAAHIPGMQIDGIVGMKETWPLIDLCAGS